MAWEDQQCRGCTGTCCTGYGSEPCTCPYVDEREEAAAPAVADIPDNIPAGFTGTILGDVTPADDGPPVRQVFEYEDGECTDRYVTTVTRGF